MTTASGMLSASPYAEGTYYKHKYDHVNIAQYKNIPVPTSYMAYRSDYNFIGEYDYGKQAGLLHVADHHIAPGKSSGPGDAENSAKHGTLH